jgi:hypothetical protein
MGIEFLAFDNQFVSHLAPDDEDDHFVSLDIIQDAQVSCPQFKLGNGLGRSRLIAFVGTAGWCWSRDWTAASRTRWSRADND